MPVKKTNNAAKSKFLIAIALAAMVFYGVVMLLEGMVDADRLRDDFQRVVKEKTGKDISIKGKAVISLLPVPTVYFQRLEVHGDDLQKIGPSVMIDMVQLTIDPLTVLGDKPQITGVIIDGPKLEVTRMRDNSLYWDWLSLDSLKSMFYSGQDAGKIKLTINDGRLVYSDNFNDMGFTVEDINFSGSIGKRTALEGSFLAHGRTLYFEMSSDEQAEVPIALTVQTDAKNKLEWHGAIRESGDTLALKGKVRLDLENVLAWIHPSTKVTEKFIDKITNRASEIVSTAEAFPIHFQSDWEQEDISINLPNAKLQARDSVGEGEGSLGWDKTPVVKLSMKFDTLNYNQWRQMTLDAIRVKQPTQSSAVELYGDDESKENPLPKQISLTLDVQADKVLMGGKSWSKVQFLAELSEAAITVHQFVVSLPGESSLSLFGIISHQPVKGLRFEGSMETRGKSLKQMLTVFEHAAEQLPDTGFSQFSMRANIFVSPEQVRLSEADVKISELYLNGGLAAYFDDNPRIEADVKLKDINFDYFRDVWREKQNSEGKKEFLINLGVKGDFDWLRRLETLIDFKVNVENFTFFERKGNFASFRIYARAGEIGIYNIRLLYPEDILEANLNVNVNGEEPSINVLLNTAELDANYFVVPKQEEKIIIETPGMATQRGAKKDVTIVPQADVSTESAADPIAAPPLPPAVPPMPSEPVAASEPATATATDAQVNTAMPPPPPVEAIPAMPALPEIHQAEQKAAIKQLNMANGDPIKWSQELIDMGWMDGWSGDFDVSIGELTLSDKKFSNVKMRSSLKKKALSIQSLGFTYWDGRCDITGTLYGGIVPGISISYTLYNILMYDMAKDITGRENLSGRLSVTGVLSTSGINFLSWVSQADAKLSMAARGINVMGFDMQGVIDAVAVSRTASDVLNNVNLAIPRGITQFSVDGTINTKNGIARTPGINVKTGSVTGNLTGELKLVPWTIEALTVFQFPAMTTETIPTMTVRLVGPIRDAEMQVDTSSLEAYVAKRIIGR
ncbi:MAG: AsmA-like C-terminal region-containing protein [Rickettsiales bacterium]|nr:AsmA-like C-terminal region-containing protein [Rickettsiales bacterium]